MSTQLIWFIQAFRKFDEMANKQTDKLRKLTKQVVSLNYLHISIVSISLNRYRKLDIIMMKIL